LIGGRGAFRYDKGENYFWSEGGERVCGLGCVDNLHKLWTGLC